MFGIYLSPSMYIYQLVYIWSRFGDEKRVADEVLSLPAVHDFGGRTRLMDIFSYPVMQWFRLAQDPRCWNEEIVNVGISPFQ